MCSTGSCLPAYLMGVLSVHVFCKSPTKLDELRPYISRFLVLVCPKAVDQPYLRLISFQSPHDKVKRIMQPGIV